MKKLLFMVLAAFTLITLSQSCKKKVSDADITTAVNAELAKMTDMTGAKAEVKDGAVTVTGVCKDQACSDKCKKALEDLKIKGVKSIDWKCTLAPASVAVNVSVDPAVQQKIKDGLKDIAGVTVNFEGNKAVFTGTTKVGNKVKISQICASSKVPADLSKVVEK